jgi:cytochrome P450
MISILVLSHHPEIQARAQEELDKVVGSNQLPDFSDREELPYVEALFKEILRMYPSVPLGKYLQYLSLNLDSDFS